MRWLVGGGKIFLPLSKIGKRRTTVRSGEEDQHEDETRGGRTVVHHMDQPNHGGGLGKGEEMNESYQPHNLQLHKYLVHLIVQFVNLL